MNFEFSEDQKFVQQTAREYLTEHAGLDVCRAVLESSRPYDADLWKGVAEMGWLGAAVPESYGGAGLGPSACARVRDGMRQAVSPSIGQIHTRVRQKLYAAFPKNPRCCR